MERNTARSCLLALETHVNIIVVVGFFLQFEGVCMEALTVKFYFIVFQTQQMAGKKLMNR